MNRRWVIIALVAIGIPALVAGWWLGSPLLLDTEVDEAFPMAASAEVPDDMSIAQVEAEMVEAAAQPTVETDEPMPETPEPVTVLAGQFADADDLHRGSGSATIYELEDGSRVLRFEDFEVTNGPDLHVILTPATSVSGRADVTEAGYVDLGALKGNVGSQNYEIPDDLDLEDYGTVVIYCVPFHVVFSVAPLTG